MVGHFYVVDFSVQCRLRTSDNVFTNAPFHVEELSVGCLAYVHPLPFVCSNFHFSETVVDVMKREKLSKNSL